jgi:hypothetical protein
MKIRDPVPVWMWKIEVEQARDRCTKQEAAKMLSESAYPSDANRLKACPTWQVGVVSPPLHARERRGRYEP